MSAVRIALQQHGAEAVGVRLRVRERERRAPRAAEHARPPAHAERRAQRRGAKVADAKEPLERRNAQACAAALDALEGGATFVRFGSPQDFEPSPDNVRALLDDQDVPLTNLCDAAEVVVVGRKHCKLEPTYEVVKDPSQASSAAELAS